MNKTWIKKNKSSQLILFFNGWGMDSSAIAHLEPNNFDVIEFNDYQDLEFNPLDYSNYQNIYVVAWSLGVWAASFILEHSNLTIKKAIAINGTQNPIDTKEGIDPAIFKGTIEGWNEKNKTRFLMRTMGGKSEFDTHISKLGIRPIENQKTELESIYKHVENNPDKVYNFRFKTALIGNQDAIFTPENQEQHWASKTNFHNMEMPHYPFLKFKDWDTIIKK